MRKGYSNYGGSFGPPASQDSSNPPGWIVTRSGARIKPMTHKDATDIEFIKDWLAGECGGGDED